MWCGVKDLACEKSCTFKVRKDFFFFFLKSTFMSLRKQNVSALLNFLYIKWSSKIFYSKICYVVIILLWAELCP